MLHIQTGKQKNTVKLILSAIVFFITFAITMRELSFRSTDFQAHLDFALNIRKECLKITTSVSDFSFQLTYPLWHILVNVCYKISRFIFGTGMSPSYSAAFVTGLVNVCTYLIITKILSLYACARAEWIAFGLCFVEPVYIPGLMDDFSFFAQGSPVIWHNPTNMIVKPFALAGFFLIIQHLRKIQDGSGVSRKESFGLSAVIFLSVLAKPSFFQGFVPALGVYILAQLCRTKFRLFREYCLLCSCFIPGFLIILGQFVISFLYVKSGQGIGIGWLEVAKAYYPYPLLQLFLVLAFPICYILFFVRTIGKTLEIRLSVLYVLCAWLEFALLYEKGERKFQGNFEWAVCLAYAVIWTVASMLFFKDRSSKSSENKGEKAKNIVLSLIWLLHFLSGLFFVWKMFTVEKLFF